MMLRILRFVCTLSTTATLLSLADSTVPKLRSPPMGWSSWYAFGSSVTQDLMEQTFAKMVNRSVIPGDNRSLADVGYTFANLDDGYQLCHGGVNGSFHDEHARRFGLKAGFYGIIAKSARITTLLCCNGVDIAVNNYICSEPTPPGGINGAAYMTVMNGTVDFVTQAGFQYLKIDSGSCYNDLNLWYTLLSASAADVTVENCHQGGYPPNSTWCPYTLWRTTGDGEIIGWDVEAAVTAEAIERNQSYESCWAYPDFVAFPGPLSDPVELRAMFSTYSIMAAPLILSFDVLDDTKLAPAWSILTNEEVIAVNQASGEPGRLLRKWSNHPKTDPIFAWADDCSDEAVGKWLYDNASSQLRWIAANTPDSAGTEACLTAGGDGQLLQIEECNVSSATQRWLFLNGRLWWKNGLPHGARGEEVGSLQAKECNLSQVGQRWRVSSAPGHSTTSNVQNVLPYRVGGCWEITGCSFGDGADVGTTYGCKPIPNGTGGCDANGAWAFNENGTITSVMSGACLRVDPKDNTTVNVGSCTDPPPKWQRWSVDGVQIQSLMATADGAEALCVDNNEAPAPPGTTSRCTSVVSTSGLVGPGVTVAVCESDQPPQQTQQVTFDGSALKIGGRCLHGRRGRPSPFGPIQLWARALHTGVAAVVLVNREQSLFNMSVSVALTEIPEITCDANGKSTSPIAVRDLWGRSDMPTLPKGAEFLTVILPPKGTVALKLSRSQATNYGRA